MISNNCQFVINCSRIYDTIERKIYMDICSMKQDKDITATETDLYISNLSTKSNRKHEKKL